MLKNEGGQADCWRSVAPYRLCDDLFAPEPGKLAQDFGAQVFVRDNPEPFEGSQRAQACHCLLDHGLLAVERQQLLGAPLPAERPKTCSPASSKDHGIEMGRHVNFRL